jgi:hypothetical protein
MFLDALKEATDPHAIGSGVAKLMALLIHKSGGKMPPQVAVPAALLLLCEVLQFMEDAGDLKVDNDLMAECTSSTGSAMLQALGVTPEKLQALKAKQGGIVSNAMGAA